MGNVSRIGVISFAAALVFYLSAIPSTAKSDPFEVAELVPVGIHNIQTGGYWTSGKDEGFFRTVVVAGGVEHVAHQLFIQWLRSDAETQDYELVRTVNVKELNPEHGHILNVKTSFGDVNSFKIDVTANSRGGKTLQFSIIAKGDGKYKIRYGR